jgi:hypothetical protein
MRGAKTKVKLGEDRGHSGSISRVRRSLKLQELNQKPELVPSCPLPLLVLREDPLFCSLCSVSIKCIAVGKGLGQCLASSGTHWTSTVVIIIVFLTHHNAELLVLLFLPFHK